MREKAEKLMSAVYTDEPKEKINNTRNAFTDIATFILENMKDSREKSLVLTKLEESCMWAIKGISREPEKVEINIPVPVLDGAALASATTNILGETDIVVTKKKRSK